MQSILVAWHVSLVCVCVCRVLGVGQWFWKVGCGGGGGLVAVRERKATYGRNFKAPRDRHCTVGLGPTNR